jgi:hypothetical protein
MEYVAQNDKSYRKIEAAMIEAIRTITATHDDRRAWLQFCKDYPNLMASARAALAQH